jgi:hypothetical protein
MFSAPQISKNLKFQSSDIEWSGTAWSCAKQLKHYSGFDRKGTTIYVRKTICFVVKSRLFPCILGPIRINSLIKRLSCKCLYVSYPRELMDMS